MRIYPAIDLKNGQVVRLSEGDYGRVEVYSSNPADMAKRFQNQGAQYLHVVDLDGAKNGEISHYDCIRSIVESSGLFVQVGGGIRDEDRIRRYLNIGVQRVILGTVAVEDFRFLEKMVSLFGEAIAVSVDARDEQIAVRGWMELTAQNSLDFCKKLELAGVSTIIYTDISKDGMMSGTNLEVYGRLRELVQCNIIASGGVSGLEDVLALRDMRIDGAIVGKAIYTGAIKLEEVLRLC